MKQTNVFKSNPMRFKHSPVGTCLTIFRTAVMVVLSVSILTACNPGSTTNNYGVGKSEMSGGGATKDPGDGTGGSTGDGGGGQGVQCGETENSDLTNRLFVRDIYEAIHNQNLRIKTIPNDITGTDSVSPEAIQMLTTSLKLYFGPASQNLKIVTEKFWTDFYKRILFIDDTKRLYPSKDANSAIALPAQCNLVQIAYWDESVGLGEQGTLYVNRVLWKNLNQTNKVALLAHEYFFALARKAHYKNSDSVRIKIGRLLSVDGLTPLFQAWSPSKDERVKHSLPESKKGFKFCRGSSVEDPSADLFFYQYQGSDGLQHISVPVLTSKAINSHPFQNANFNFHPILDGRLLTGTDILIVRSALARQGKANSIGDSALTQWWNENSGLLSVSWWQDTLETLKRSMSDYHGETLWTGILPETEENIYISLKNPDSGTLKSQEELISIVHDRITSSLNRCRNNEEPDAIALAAIPTLDKEIKDALNQGKYPKGFPKWTKILEQITSKYSNDNYFCGQITNLNQPTFLYQLFSKNYNSETAERFLGNEAFTQKPTRFGSHPIISATQGSKTVDFELRCEDYNTVFSIASRIETQYPPISISERKKILVLSRFRTSSEFQQIDNVLGTMKKTYEDHIAERNKQIPEELPTLQKLSDFLAFTGNNAKMTFELFMEAHPKCGSHRTALGTPCKQTEFFLSDLAQATEIEIEPCEHAPYEKIKPENNDTIVCANINMMKLSRIYRIYFSFTDSEESNLGTYPTLKLVRQIPK